MNRRNDQGRIFERLAAKTVRILFYPDLLSVKRNIILKGQSGAGHEIDLLLEIRKKRRILHAAVECKNRARPIEKEKVAAFRSVLRDINAFRGKDQQLKGIMISACGYQSGAINMARDGGILLLEMRKPDPRDWHKAARLLLKEQGTDLPDRFCTVRLELSLTSNEQIRIVPDWLRLRKKGMPDWRMDSPLSRDPHSLMIGGKSLMELREALPGKDTSVRRREVMDFPDGLLTHLVWEGELPVKQIRFSFDDLTREAKDFLLYGPEVPDLIVSEPVSRLRIGIVNGRRIRLPDPE